MDKTFGGVGVFDAWRGCDRLWLFGGDNSSSVDSSSVESSNVESSIVENSSESETE